MAERKKTITKKNAVNAPAAVTAEALGLSVRHEVSPVEFALWVRALRQNWRQGTVKVKDRSEVSLSNRKPWKQKGTGRARAGTFRSPLWRKGGVIFGPQARTRKLSVAQHTRTRVLNALIWQYADAQRIHQLALEALQAPKTSAAVKALQQAGIHQERVVIFVRHDDYVAQSSFANLPNIQLMVFDQANSYDLANADHIAFLDNDASIFKAMVAQWN